MLEHAVVSKHRIRERAAMAIVDELSDMRERALADLAPIGDLDRLAEWKNAYLGKQGALTRLSRSLGALPAEERPRAGQQFNAARHDLERALSEADERLR